MLPPLLLLRRGAVGDGRTVRDVRTSIIAPCAAVTVCRYSGATTTLSPPSSPPSTSTSTRGSVWVKNVVGGGKGKNNLPFFFTLLFFKRN